MSPLCTVTNCLYIYRAQISEALFTIFMFVCMVYNAYNSCVCIQKKKKTGLYEADEELEGRTRNEMDAVLQWQDEFLDFRLRHYIIFSNLSSLFTLCIDLANSVKKIPAPMNDPFAKAWLP